MTVLSIVQDPQNKGGIDTVVRWYRKWMNQNRPGEWVETFLDDSTTTSDFIRISRRWKLEDPIPRLFPRLHAPQFYAGRELLRRRCPEASEMHVIGASALQGFLGSNRYPSLVWMATTVGDERRRTMSYHSLRRRILYRLTLRALEEIEWRVLDESKRILTLSPYTANLLVESGLDARKIEIKPTPIDTAVFRPGLEPRQGLLFVGRAHDPRKNFDALLRLVEASPLVREHGLTVVSPSSPPLSPKLQSGNTLKWLTNVDDLPSVYRSVEVLVLTSHQEGLGIVVFEALACGTPVVSLPCGGPDQLLLESGGGILVENERSLRAAVDSVLNEPAMQSNLGRAGRQWVERNMAADNFLSDTDLFRLT